MNTKIIEWSTLQPRPDRGRQVPGGMALTANRPVRVIAQTRRCRYVHGHRWQASEESCTDDRGDRDRPRAGHRAVGGLIDFRPLSCSPDSGTLSIGAGPTGCPIGLRNGGEVRPGCWTYALEKRALD